MSDVGRVSWLHIVSTGLVSAVALAGCAIAPAAPPAEFPFQASAPPLVTLHWRVDRDPARVVATGIAEIASPDRLDGAVIELQGLDREGRVVSSGVTRVEPRAFAGDVRWPFTARLTPRGDEDRFTVRVAEVSWRVIRGGR
jgi:hypothetical protein